MERALCVLQDNSKVLTGQQHVWIWQGMEHRIALLVKGSAVPPHLIKMASLGLLQMMAYVPPVFQVSTHHYLTQIRHALTYLQIMICSAVMEKGS